MRWRSDIKRRLKTHECEEVLEQLKSSPTKIFPQKCNFPHDVYTSKKDLLNPLGSNVENGFGVISLHANEIIMSALSGYQKQAFISSRDVVGFAL